MFCDFEHSLRNAQTYCREVSDWFGKSMGIRDRVKKKKIRLVSTQSFAMALEEISITFESGLDSYYSSLIKRDVTR